MFSHFIINALIYSSLIFDKSASYFAIYKISSPLHFFHIRQVLIFNINCPDTYKKIIIASVSFRNFHFINNINIYTWSVAQDFLRVDKRRGFEVERRSIFIFDREHVLQSCSSVLLLTFTVENRLRSHFLIEFHERKKEDEGKSVKIFTELGIS